ncbi:hypothetical protein [Mobiluncus mulieris]|uniref:hypothetical protein n=1 Tax=Mobiluncus mulieris TaxID=2052 RepID=UPI000DFE1DFA|nr:hypothetical protein [Mobiluncus mulieris]STY84701.1 Uncharacterised protein [Mobiluncus mulieris]
MVYEPPYTYLLDGVDVREWTFLASNLTHSEISPRVQNLSVPGRLGNIIVPQSRLVLDAPLLDLELAPAAESPAALEAALDRLQTILMNPLLRVIRVRPYGDDSRPQRSVTPAQLVNAKPTREDGHASLWARWKIQLRLPEVAWRDLKPKTVVVSPGKAVRVNGLSGTLPIEDIKIHAQGPLTQLRLRDCQTGTGVTFTGVIHSGESLSVDLATLTAVKRGAGGESTPVTGGLDYPPTGKLILGLEPKTRRVRLDVQVEGYKKEETVVSLEGRRAWM